MTQTSHPADDPDKPVTYAATLPPGLTFATFPRRGESVTYLASGLPDGLTLSSRTGVIGLFEPPPDTPYIIDSRKPNVG